MFEFRFIFFTIKKMPKKIREKHFVTASRNSEFKCGSNCLPYFSAIMPRITAHLLSYSGLEP